MIKAVTHVPLGHQKPHETDREQPATGDSQLATHNPQLFKAVIFDFGRVISAPKPPSLFRRYELDLGLQPDTINRIMFESKAWDDALHGRLTEAQFWEAIGPELGLHCPHDINSFRRRYRRDETINTSVVELIRRLRPRHQLALLSNAPPGLSQWLEDWKIRGLFDVVFCSGDEGLAKPHPAVFQTVLQRLGVMPGEALFVDDTIEHVRAAEGLGLQAILFGTARELTTQLAHLLP